MIRPLGWERRGDALCRQDVMDLIEAQIPLWSEDTPPRHALSVLWGKVRDMPSASDEP